MPPAGYAELSRVVIKADTVLLYADARISPALQDSLWSESSPCLLDADHPLRRFCQTNFDTLRSAIVRVRLSGRPASLVPLRKALAKISPVALKSLPFPAVFVTEDDQPDFGTYRGPVTRVLLLPPQGRVRWALVHESTHPTKGRELHLLDAGKAQWTADTQEIRIIQCQPRAVADSVVFDLTLRRMRPRSSGDWEEVSATRDGFWEADMGMPDASVFPDWPN